MMSRPAWNVNPRKRLEGTGLACSATLAGEYRETCATSAGRHRKWKGIATSKSELIISLSQRLRTNIRRHNAATRSNGEWTACRLSSSTLVSVYIVCTALTP